MLLYNIEQGQWDSDLLSHFRIPRAILPEVVPTQSLWGEARIDRDTVPILCGIGDQQASLIGLGGLAAGFANINYGTGGFFLVHTGSDMKRAEGLLTSIARSNQKGTTYLLEGTVNSVGSLLSWLKQMGILRSENEIESLCRASLAGCRPPVFFLPALIGLAAPHWNPTVRSVISCLTRESRREDIVRAAVEGIAFRINEINAAMRAGAVQINRRIVSGGLSQIPYLIQFQADLFGQPLFRSNDLESTVRGAAFLALEQAGETDPGHFCFSDRSDAIPTQIGSRERRRLVSQWNRGMELAKGDSQARPH
jgi:glycerol kinase